LEKGNKRGIEDNNSIKRPVIKSSVLILRPPPLQRRTLSLVTYQKLSKASSTLVPLRKGGTKGGLNFSRKNIFSTLK
jgi:hypothetical protein